MQDRVNYSKKSRSGSPTSLRDGRRHSGLLPKLRHTWSRAPNPSRRLTLPSTTSAWSEESAQNGTKSGGYVLPKVPGVGKRGEKPGERRPKPRRFLRPDAMAGTQSAHRLRSHKTRAGPHKDPHRVVSQTTPPMQKGAKPLVHVDDAANDVSLERRNRDRLQPVRGLGGRPAKSAMVSCDSTRWLGIKPHMNFKVV